MASLRKRINQNCKDCIYDRHAPGTWRQQVTLCAAKECSLYPVRPITQSPIPQKVLEYYQVSDEEYREVIDAIPQGGSNG